MDRTLLYREIVRLANPVEANEPSQKSVADAVTTECADIAASVRRLERYLVDIRPQYLALAGPHQLTDKDKDSVDYEVRSMLQAEQQRVRNLERLERTRADSARPHSMASRLLTNPAVTGASDTLSRHRQGMFFYLNSQLQRASAELIDLQRVRMARRVPHSSGGAQGPIKPLQGFKGPTRSPQPARNEPQPGGQDHRTIPTNSQDQAEGFEGGDTLLLQEENDELLEELSATLGKAQQAEQSLREIAELQAELSTHLETQALTLDRLGAEVDLATEDIGGANQQLERSKRRNRRASRVVMWTALTSGLVLLYFNR